jgi:hypothetical protein
VATVAIGPGTAGALALAVVNSASSLIAAPAGVSNQIIRVYRLFLVVGAATNITFQDGANAQSGPLPMITNGTIVLDIDGTAWFTTSPGNPFNIANSGSVQVSGTVYYMLQNP